MSDDLQTTRELSPDTVSSCYELAAQKDLAAELFPETPVRRKGPSNTAGQKQIIHCVYCESSDYKVPPGGDICPKHWSCALAATASQSLWVRHLKNCDMCSKKIFKCMDHDTLAELLIDTLNAESRPYVGVEFIRGKLVSNALLSLGEVTLWTSSRRPLFKER